MASDRIPLSPDFFLDEFTRSQTARRHGIEIVVERQSPEFRNLQRPRTEVLQPARDAFGPIIVTSGYRPERVNELIGGSSTSAHRYACAGDIEPLHAANRELAEWLAARDLPYDQVIYEFGDWVHVGIAREGGEPRGEVLTSLRDPEAGVVYRRGVQAV